MRYRVILTRTYEVQAGCPSDAVMRAFDAEHMSPDHTPTIEVELLNAHPTEAEVSICRT